MIKSKTIKFKVTSGLKQNYSNLGYNFNNDEVEIKVDDLKKSSQVKVLVICDLCDGEFNIIYSKYNINVNRNGFYSCKECGLKKRSYDFSKNNLSLNKDYQEKKKKTFLKNYGYDNPSKSQEIKDKKVKTLLKNFGTDYQLILNELKIAGMFKKYGVSHPSKSQEVKNKMKSKLISKYGVDNISKIEDVKKSKIRTSLINYGVLNPMQSEIVFKKQLLSAYRIVYYNDELFCQGSYELDFLNYCDKENIIDLISNGPSVNYNLESDNTTHVYHSDFYISKLNLIIEIKSDYTYFIELDKNLMKEKYCKINGYNFLFIINKNYTVFDEYLKKIQSI